MTTALSRAVGGAVLAARSVASTALIALMLLFCVDVVSRYFFTKPIPGVYEITTTLLLPFVVFFGMAVSIPVGGHVRLGVLYDRFAPRGRRIVYVLSLVFAAIFWGAVALAVGGRAIEAFSLNQVSTVSFGLPIAWSYTIVAAGAGLTALVSLACTALPEPPHDDTDPDEGGM